MSQFVHLHNHTHYSLLDGACTPKQLVQAAAADGQTALAMTDHGVMFGAMEFFKLCNKNNIKPIIGCEVYVAVGSRFDKTARKGPNKTRNYYHLVLLAKNQTGYRNLIKMVSLGHTEGFYYKPRIDRELLEKHSEGLVALSACAGGVVSAHVVDGKLDKAREAAMWYKQVFGDDFYLEIQDHNLVIDPPIMEHVPVLAGELGIKLIATNDCHYVEKNHAVAHNVLLHIKDVSAANSGKVDVTKLRYQQPEFYLKSQTEMLEIFKDYPDAIANTLEVAEKCNFEFENKLHMPVFPIPEESPSETLEEYLREITYKGLEMRYGDIPDDARKRADYELDVINSMGYPGYFLIVEDFIRAARDLGVSVGPGRGSAAGSLVAYALEITNVDPLKYDLLFERFLNPDRVSMPDIDIDFNDEKRERVIDYCREKYGPETVAQIITFGTLSTRAVIKDVGRVLGVPLFEVEKITKNIPVVFGRATPLKESLELPELRWVKQSPDPKIKQMIEYSLLLEGFCRNTSLHAAGVVIAPGDVSDFVPLYKTPTSELATQFNMNDLEEAGLLKMDFLGLRTLSIIDKTLEMVQHRHDIEIDIDEIDINDKDTFELFGNGRTVSVFQFESEPMQKSLRMLKPNSLEDLTAMNALYRPGPMANIPEFCDRKHGRKPIEYLHPIMEPALKNTYGIIVYQEQVMQLVRDVAGFTLAQADILRRAMGKKKLDVMAEQKEVFIEGAAKRDINAKLANEIFELIEKFASYGFNKSHALAYSYLAFQTAWLKTHYTAEFFSANLTAEMNSLDKIVQIIDDAKTFGIEVLPPDVNESLAVFAPVSDTEIRYGLAATKNLGVGPVQAIIDAREEAPFTSFFDFVTRVDSKSVNKRCLEALICSGAFDSLGNGTREQYLEVLDEAIRFAQAQSKSGESNMDSLFGGESEESAVREPVLPDVLPWTPIERLKREREYLNFYVSGHPLDKYRPHVTSLATLMLGEREESKIGGTSRVCGIVTAIRTKLDKRENQIAFVTIEDFTGKAECIFWSDAWAQFRETVTQDSILMMVGRSDLNGSDSLKVIVEEVMTLPEAVQRYAQALTVRVQREETDPNLIQQAAEIARNNPGSTPLWFSVYQPDTTLGARYKSQEPTINMEEDVIVELMRLFGSRNVQFMGKN